LSDSNSQPVTTAFSLLCVRDPNFFPAKRLSGLTRSFPQSSHSEPPRSLLYQFVSNCHSLSQSHKNRSYTTPAVDTTECHNRWIIATSVLVACHLLRRPTVWVGSLLQRPHAAICSARCETDGCPFNCL
jgi:hypothetical protein